MDLHLSIGHHAVDSNTLTVTGLDYRMGATVYKAIETMAGKSIGALLVLDDGQLCGTLAGTPTSSRGPGPRSYPILL